jgi:hypothetical protein
MSRDPLRLGDYLGHILEAISQINTSRFLKLGAN